MLAGLITGVVAWMALADLGPAGAPFSGLAGLLAWWLESLLWPFAPCWWCRGKPHTSYSLFTPKAWRECRVCDGRGKRRRMLARSQ